MGNLIYLDGNTIKCTPETVYGYSEDIDGVTYYVTDNTNIATDVLEDPIIDGTAVTGFAHLCTSLITTGMQSLFMMQQEDYT